MNDYYLKFPNEAAAVTALEGVDAAIDVVGILILWPEPIQIGTEQVDMGDGTFVENPIYDRGLPETLSGYHVNLRGELPASLEKYQVYPSNPSRVWA